VSIRSFISFACSAALALSASAALAATQAPAGTARPAIEAIELVKQAPTLKVVTPHPNLKKVLANKKLYDPKKLAEVLHYAGKVPVLVVKGKQYHLQPVQEPAVPRASIKPLAPALLAKIKKYEAYWNKITWGKPISADILKYLLGLMVDHRNVQTAIRDQGNRGTCVAHASVAALEAMYKRAGQTKDLSENDAYNIFMAGEGSTCVADPGLLTWKAAGYLTASKICTEAQNPYILPKGNTACQATATACSSNRKHGFTSTSVFYAPAFGGTGTSVATNTKFLESLLFAGHDVVMGVYVAGNDWNDGTSESGVIDVQKDAQGNPAAAYGGHAMLLVGYDSAKGYFIFKNSWTASRGHAGYFYLSYEYLQTYAKYGFAVLGVTPA
jgi:hypothetical protein